jgi:hypothetical protein
VTHKHATAIVLHVGDFGDNLKALLKIDGHYKTKWPPEHIFVEYLRIDDRI